MTEGKNCHIVETARTLLLHHTSMFLGAPILIACYLINRMPSYVLGDQVPHSLLFPNQPLFCLPLRVFGCTCFVHILTPDQNKLSTKATKCIFLGYSRLQCGYRCYSPDTHRYFIFVDVTFFLTFFYLLYPHRLLVPMFYLYLSSFPFRPYHLSPQLLLLVRNKFILVVCIPTPGQGVLHENRGHTQIVGYCDTNWASSPAD